MAKGCHKREIAELYFFRVGGDALVERRVFKTRLNMNYSTISLSYRSSLYHSDVKHCYLDRRHSTSPSW